MSSDKSRVDMAQAVARMIENMPAMMDLERAQAKLTRCKYEALVREGFTVQEALELCKKQ